MVREGHRKRMGFQYFSPRLHWAVVVKFRKHLSWKKEEIPQGYWDDTM